MSTGSGPAGEEEKPCNVHGCGSEFGGRGARRGFASQALAKNSSSDWFVACAQYYLSKFGLRPMQGYCLVGRLTSVPRSMVGPDWPTWQQLQAL